MSHNQPFNWVERQLQRIPTWIFVGVFVVGLAVGTWVVSPELDKATLKGGMRVLLGGLESIAIIAAVILYFKEIPDRKARKHYEAFQVIDAAHGIKTSDARRKALEDLIRDGVPLNGLDLSLADLRGINLRRAELIDVDLRGANLYKADLRGANLYGVKLSPIHLETLKDPINLEVLDDPKTMDEYVRADLSESDLSGVTFKYTFLTGARLYKAKAERARFENTIFNGANLYQASLAGATFDSVYFTCASLVETDFTGAKGLANIDLIRAKLCQTKLPEGVDLRPDRNCLDD